MISDKDEAIILMSLWEGMQDMNFGEIRQIREAALNAAKDEARKIRRYKIASAAPIKSLVCPHCGRAMDADGKCPFEKNVLRQG